jgi:hypothetical protein
MIQAFLQEKINECFNQAGESTSLSTCKGTEALYDQFNSIDHLRDMGIYIRQNGGTMACVYGCHGSAVEAYCSAVQCSTLEIQMLA